jgi:hypothetical protein
MSPGVPPRSSWVHRPSPGRIRRALRDATARPASYPNWTSPSRGGEVLTQQSDGGGDHIDRLHDEPLGSCGDGRQWPHMPSSVLGDAFGQAQDSGIISSTRVLALDSALSSGKYATINWGGVNHGILWKDTKARQIIFRYAKVQQTCIVGGYLLSVSFFKAGKRTGNALA